MPTSMKTYWVTKYALTKTGIVKVRGEIPEWTDSLIVPNMMDMYPVRDYHETAELAVAKAKEMRVAKIKNLRKQIEKLEALKFG